MRFVLFFSLLILLTLGCRKEEPRVDMDISIKDADVLTILPNGARRIKLAIEITQIGDYFYRDFHAVFTESESEKVLEEYSVTLPTAKEWVFRTVEVPTAGTYYLKTELLSEKGILVRGEGRGIIIP